jgi:hypothetical protein
MQHSRAPSGQSVPGNLYRLSRPLVGTGSKNNDLNLLTSRGVEGGGGMTAIF